MSWVEDAYAAESATLAAAERHENADAELPTPRKAFQSCVHRYACRRHWKAVNTDKRVYDWCECADCFEWSEG